MRYIRILIFVVMAMLMAVKAYPVSLTIPAAGTTLTESEYDGNNDLVETAVSQLDAVDATKHDKSAFTSASTFAALNFNNYTANHRTYLENYTAGVSGQLALKHSAAAFTDYSTYRQTLSDSKLTASRFEGYSTYQESRYVNYTSQIRTYMDNHQFFRYADGDDATYFSCDSTIYLVDAFPSYTSGQSVGRFTYTPIAIGNELQVKADIQTFMPTINKHVIVALFVNNTCIDVRVKDSTAANEYLSFSMESDYYVWSTTAVPVEMRIGTATGATFYVNGNASSRMFGGAMKAHVAVTETN